MCAMCTILRGDVANDKDVTAVKITDNTNVAIRSSTAAQCKLAMHDSLRRGIWKGINRPSIREEVRRSSAETVGRSSLATIIYAGT